MKTIAYGVVLALLTGCAIRPQTLDYSLIDPKGVDMAKYQLDFNECAVLANQTRVAQRAAAGIVIGAIGGALIGGLLCGRVCAEAGARGGAAGGVLGATQGGVQEQQTTLRACLSGRGYTVIR